MTDVAAVYTTSGNEITDATRVAAASWTTATQGGSTDGLTPPAGVAVWESGTNVFPRGQVDSLVSSWLTTSNCSHALDPTTPPPYSSQSDELTTQGVIGNEGSVAVSTTGLAAAAGTIGTGSIYLKGVAGQTYDVFLQWVNTDTTTTTGTVTTVTATGAWQLVVAVPLAVAAAKTGDQVRIRAVTHTQRAESFWVAHAMMQSGPLIPSPYIATSGGATAARAAARVQAPATLLNATQGWFAMRVTMGWGATSGPSGAGLDNFLNWWNGTANERLALVYDETTDQWRARRWHLGAGTDALSAVQAFARGDAVTIVVAWTATALAISVNGAAFVSVANSSIPTGLNSLFDLGSRDGTAFFCDSAIRWFACGSGVLTNADASAIGSLPDAMPALFPEAAASIAGGWMLYAPVGPKFRRVRVGEPVVTTD